MVALVVGYGYFGSTINDIVESQELKYYVVYEMGLGDKYMQAY